MLLNKFDGGKSIRVHPSLILANESVISINVDDSAINLKPAKDVTEIGSNIDKYFYNYLNSWVYSVNERSYVEYKNKLYFTEDGSNPKVYNGFRLLNLGIEAPVAKLTCLETAPPGVDVISTNAEVLQYTYTYYNSQDGVESAPAPVSDELSLAANKVVTLSGFVPSTDIQVDTIRIYRLGDDITSMTLVDEVSSTISNYIDVKNSLNLLDHILDSYNNQPAIQGLKYLVEAYGIFFAAKDDKLYFSKIGEPAYWPTSNYIDFNEEITGLLPTNNGLLVFSLSKTKILVGTSAESFNLLKVSETIGCKNHLTNKSLKSFDLWVCLEGIAAYNGGSIEVISRDKLGSVNLDTINAAVLNDVYYLTLTNGNILALDLRFGASFKEYIFSKPIHSLYEHKGVLYACNNALLLSLFTGPNLEYTYKTGKLIDNTYTVIKLYNNVYIRSNGEINVKAYIDDELVADRDLTGDVIHDYTIPEEKQRGTSIQFEFSGSGEIFEIEYKAVGRANGR